MFVCVFISYCETRFGVRNIRVKYLRFIIVKYNVLAMNKRRLFCRILGYTWLSLSGQLWYKINICLKKIPWLEYNVFFEGRKRISVRMYSISLYIKDAFALLLSVGNSIIPIVQNTSSLLLRFIYVLLPTSLEISVVMF